MNCSRPKDDDDEVGEDECEGEDDDDQLLPPDLLGVVLVLHPGLAHWSPVLVFQSPQAESQHSQNLVAVALLSSLVALTSTSLWPLLWSSICGAEEFLRGPLDEVLVKLV